MQVTVAWSSTARRTVVRQLTLHGGARLRDALAQAALPDEVRDGLRTGSLSLSLWGRPAGLDDLLRERDRVEICRALRVDPKVARRERFRKQGTRAAGLFAKTRADGKAGY